MTTTWAPVRTDTSDGSTVVAEDILTGPLKKRGQLVYRGDVDRGFPGMAQHFTGEGTSRPAPSTPTHPSGGLMFTGIGADADGYGARDSGSGGYLRLDRFKEDTWYTNSFRFAMTSEQPGTVTNFTSYIDSQGWDAKTSDSGRRAYPRLRWNDALGNWEIRKNNGGYVSIPGATWFPGDNENKLDDTFCSWSFFHAKSTPDDTSLPFGSYGHFQIGGQVFDLRGLGAGWSDEPTQAPPARGLSFAGGNNFGFGASTPIPGMWGGFIISRWEITVGDTIV